MGQTYPPHNFPCSAPQELHQGAFRGTLSPYILLSEEVHAGASGYTLTLDSSNGYPTPSALISGDNFATPMNGMQKVVDISPWSCGVLTPPFNWGASSGWPGSTVTNANLRVEDADTGQTLLEEQLIVRGVYGTGWRTYSKDISSYVSGHSKILITLYLYDGRIANWNQKNLYDNIMLESSGSGSSAAGFRR